MRAVFTGLPEASPEELFRRELFSSRLCQPLLSQGMRRSFVECMKLVGEAWEGTEPGLQPGGASVTLYVLVVVAVIASLLRLGAAVASQWFCGTKLLRRRQLSRASALQKCHNAAASTRTEYQHCLWSKTLIRRSRRVPSRGGNSGQKAVRANTAPAARGAIAMRGPEEQPALEMQDDLAMSPATAGPSGGPGLIGKLMHKKRGVRVQSHEGSPF